LADKTIRVSAETWRPLKDRKREGESFDDVIRRLSSDRWRGFGALAGVGDGIRRVHRELRDEIDVVEYRS